MRNDFLKINGIIAFLLVGFLNAFVDLGHKIIIQNTVYKIYDGSTQLFLTAIINALILLPYIFSFSISGFLADKYPKNKVMKITALANIFLVSIICFSYYNGYFYLAFIMTLIMGIQSALYSPAKYGYIKELVGIKQLAMGNGAINAVSIVAILCGMLVFSLGFELLLNEFSTSKDILTQVAPLGLLLVAFSVLEFILASKLPQVKSENSNLAFNKNDYLKGVLLKNNLSLIFQNKVIWLCIIGIAFFWAISQLYLVSFPVFAKFHLNELNTFYVQGVMAASAIGVIIGSIIAGRFSKNYIELGLIPLGALGLFLSSLLISFLNNLFAFALVFFIFGISGAIFTIALNSLIQFNAKENELGIVLAGNNFIQNIFMLSFVILATFFAYLEIDVLYLFYFIVVVSFLGSFYVLIKLPFSLVRIIVSLAFYQKYRLLVAGFENIPQNKGVLLLGNHISFIDWAIIQMAIPKKVHFVMERKYYQKWYIRMFIKHFGVIPVSSAASKEALELIATYIKKGEIVCIFPEGTLSRHGHLNEFKSGFELACKDLSEDDGIIIPFYIHGLWGSSFSRSDEEYNLRNKKIGKREIAIAFGTALSIHSSKELVKAKVFELSFLATKTQSDNLKTIEKAFILSAKKYSQNIAINDPLAGDISYKKFLALSLVLSKKIPNDENIGILLPASFASTLVNLASLFAGKTIVNLNYTAGIKAINQAKESANIKHIYTSSKFLEKLENKGFKLELENVNIIYLEDLIKAIKKEKLDIIFKLFLISILPSFILQALFTKNLSNEKTAAILFSSGSEGMPKGVMLSHKNILSNIASISSIICAKDDDVILSSLPPFHAFGLTVTTFMPLIEGIKSATCADPTDALGVAKTIVKNNVSIMCATSTFLGIYARNKKIDEIMFDSLRIVVAGAEKLKPEIKSAFELKFKKNIYEGYGATETTPVASVNLPNKFDSTYWQLHRANKDKSVGMPLPGTAIRIVDPLSYEELKANEDGLILIGGHQVMQGYLNNPEKTAEVIKEIDGIRWYNTGDKGHLDEDGFLYIVDRYSRFAKIGGEMISLGLVESEVAKVINNDEVKLCSTSLEDDKKGEMVVLLIECSEEKFDYFVDLIKQSEILAIYKPSKYILIKEIPLLGSGKVDYKEAKALAKSILENN
ncbi:MULTISPECIES: acyl-[ACP]--phospholipid O-acyltransferase [unclassified Campylobacter]|uniref:acyl-[ACP]--phospholipid O-acyltransferase n=1 Tax=unclassified Campylobacter TaxID=2593542 RepID=UPI001D6230F2|nr:acyl-[ACP]--phospholipid O-acyltransferase [Campylobacter sp. RM9331]MBZ8006021.1 acyl-[ACP]--phospholipid O-acyltransferase [Campylobacter sp. RM9332]